ncbi:MAG: CcdB family protein [Pseudomonadota bacterium]
MEGREPGGVGKRQPVHQGAWLLRRTRQKLLTALFDIVENLNRSARGRAPYFVLLKHDHLDDLPTVVLAPLVPLEAFSMAERLHPPIVTGNERYLLSITDTAAVPKKAFGSSVANAAAQCDEIIAALDLLFSGV